MKFSFQSLAIAALIGAAALEASAASLPTTVSESISIQLTGGMIGKSTTNKTTGAVTTSVATTSIGNKDVIRALGGSAKAQLMLVGQISYTTYTNYTTDHSKVTTNTVTIGEVSHNNVVLRDGGVDAPVTNITVDTLSTNVSPSVESSVISASGLDEGSVTYKISQFRLRTATLDFTVGGLVVTTRASQTKGNVAIFYSTTSGGPAPSALSGTFGVGDPSADVGVCSGTIKTSSPAIK